MIFHAAQAMLGGWCCAEVPSDNFVEQDPIHFSEDLAVYNAPKAVHGVRTTVDDVVSAEDALDALKKGNARFVSGSTGPGATEDAWRHALSSHGQSPLATVIGCADSRCPVEIIFDAKPGDIFVLRNAGNTCTHSEGSMVGSVEYSVRHLRTKLVLVLGHTKCGAIAGATKTMLAGKEGEVCTPCNTVLDLLLSDLVPVAAQAAHELRGVTDADAIAAHAIKVNVMHTMERLLEYSSTVRDLVRSGEVQLHGGIYDLDSGSVEFLGRLPREKLLLDHRTTLTARPKDELINKLGSDVASTAASTAM